VFAAPSRSSRRLQPSVLEPVAPLAAAEPSGSLLRPFPDNLPAVPLRGSDSAPLPDLLAWRAEVCASAIELSTAQAAQKAAQAAREAAQAAEKAAQVAREAAQAVEKAAEARVAEADRRGRTAWTQYANLVGAVVSDSQPPSGSDAPARSRSKDEGKGKARATTPTSDDEEEVDEVLEPSDDDKDDDDLLGVYWTFLQPEQ
jgi:hypothetical protein